MKEHGLIIIASEYGNVQQEIPTLQCAHCGMHFQVKRGSGIKRGFCQLCNQVTCGQEKCQKHFPWQKKIDLVEAGKLPLSEL